MGGVSREYSLNLSDSKCNSCPDDAYCWGGANIGPKPGHWRISAYSDKILTCPNKAACLGVEPFRNDDPKGKCNKEDGYTGHICATCTDDFSSGIRSTCSKCPDPILNILRIIALFLLLLTAIFVMIRSSLINASKPKSLFSVYMRILTNYLQLVTLASSFELQWPTEFRSFFETQEQVGTYGGTSIFF